MSAAAEGRVRVAFRPTLRRPVLDRLNLRVGQRAIVDELARASRSGFHGGIGAPPGRVGDERHPLADVAIGLQAERADFPGTMTGRAVREDDRRDILRERHLSAGMKR